MTANKAIVGNFSPVTTYKLNVTIARIGSVTLIPAGREYAAGTLVTITANTLPGSTFSGYSGDITEPGTVHTVTMDALKNVTATFAWTMFSIRKGDRFRVDRADSFAGPTKDGQYAADTFTIAGASQFNVLCESLYYRQQAFKNNVTTME